MLPDWLSAERLQWILLAAIALNIVAIYLVAKFVRKLITYMMEDASSIAVGLDYLFIAKAIERIGDHATNIAELAIFVAHGTDVRHISLEDLEREVSDPDA